MKTYGYCRISTAKQSIERQIRNIKTEYPDSIIYQEVFTGTKTEGRQKWQQLLKIIKPGDTIVFDSVSRMSRNANEGITTYMELVEKGIGLVFLKEHYIDSVVYKSAMVDKIELQGTIEDEIFKGLNNYFRKLAEGQIQIAFEQAQKEVDDLHQRTKEGIQTARINGKQIGAIPGKKLVTKKSIQMKKQIVQYSKKFCGTLNDSDCIRLLKISRNSYYKYCKELLAEEAVI